MFALVRLNELVFVSSPNLRLTLFELLTSFTFSFRLGVSSALVLDMGGNLVTVLEFPSLSESKFYMKWKVQF